MNANQLADELEIRWVTRFCMAVLAAVLLTVTGNPAEDFFEKVMLWTLTVVMLAMAIRSL